MKHPGYIINLLFQSTCNRYYQRLFFCFSVSLVFAQTSLAEIKLLEKVICATTFEDGVEKPTIFFQNFAGRAVVLDKQDFMKVKKFSTFFMFLLNTDIKKLSGHSAELSWSDFEEIDNVTQALKANLIELELDPKVNAPFTRIMLRLLNHEYVLKPLRSANQAAIDVDQLSIAKTSLLRAYREKVKTLFELLPPSLAPHFMPIPDESKKQLYKNEAEKLMRTQTSKFESLLPQTGFSTLKDFTDYIQSSNAVIEVGEIADIRKEFAALENGSFALAMRRPTGARFWLANGVGFQNQRATGTSQGILDTRMRDTAEANGLDMPAGKYIKLSNDIKPTYGFLSQSAASLNRKVHDETEKYGSDIYLFKKESVIQRVSFTFTDSLYLFMSRADQATWDRSFIPLAFYPLISLAQNLVTRGPRLAGTAKFKIRNMFHDSGPYVELQFWGPLDLEDVETFIFQKIPPSGAFLKKLERLNIEILDGRLMKTKPWKGN